MKNIIAERIRNLDILLNNKEAELQKDEGYTNSPFTQGNISELRDSLYDKKKQLERIAEDPSHQKNTFKSLNEGLNEVEGQIKKLQIVKG